MLTAIEIAYGKIAEAISDRLRWYLQSGPVVREGVEITFAVPCFYHQSQSDLEWFADLLLKLDIIKPATSYPGECFFERVVEQQDVAAHAAARMESGPELEELLAAFLYHASDFGGGFRVYRRKSFPVCVEYDALFRDLNELGYLRREGLEYAWTEKAEPVMKRAYLWSDDEEELEDEPEDEEEAAHLRLNSRR